jgi:hypothetical protein
MQPGAIVPVDMNTVRILLDALRERLAQPKNGGPKTPPKPPESRMDAGFEGGPKRHRARGEKK